MNWKVVATLAVLLGLQVASPVHSQNIGGTLRDLLAGRRRGGGGSTGGGNTGGGNAGGSGGANTGGGAQQDQSSGASQQLTEQDNENNLVNFLNKLEGSGGSFSTGGRQQPPCNSDFCPEPEDYQADLLVLIDGSGSIGETTFEEDVKAIAYDVIDAVDYQNPIHPEGTNVAVFQFSELALFQLECVDRGYTGNLDYISDCIFNMNYQRGRQTCTAEALEAVDIFVAEFFKRPDAQKILFILTDGKSNCNPNTCEVADLIRNYGTEVFVYGVGTNLDEYELDCIGGGSGTYAISSSFSLAKNTVNRAKNAVKGIGQ